MSEHYLIFAPGEVDQKVVNVMVAYLADLAVTQATKLTIAISCPGGNVVAGITIYNALAGMPYEIVSVALGSVAAMASRMSSRHRRTSAGNAEAYSR